jgi:hypothetical protein
VTYTGEQIKTAIDDWAETQVDDSIARQIALNKSLNEKYGEAKSYGYGSYKRKVTVEEFDRETVRNHIAENFYDGEDTIELPGLGLAKLVDSYGGEGQGDEWWRVFEIDGEHYKADHYYSSYDTEPWHTDCTIFPVVGREKVVTEWVAQ